jgi:hypothetical protein
MRNQHKSFMKFLNTYEKTYKKMEFSMKDWIINTLLNKKYLTLLRLLIILCYKKQK